MLEFIAKLFHRAPTPRPTDRFLTTCRKCHVQRTYAWDEIADGCQQTPSFILAINARQAPRCAGELQILGREVG